jgi:hypothetical protein
MSEEDVRNGLLAAVADEPPLGLDPDELVATARRLVRRRALVATALATVVVAVVAVAVPIALSGDSRTTEVADRPTGVTTAPYAVDDLRERGDQMAEHLRDTLPSALPAASDFTVGEFGGEAQGEFYPGQTSINSATSFTIKGGRYSIMVSSWVPGGMPRGPDEICVVRCKQLADRDGGSVYTQTEQYGRGTITSVFHVRDTGGLVLVNAYNYDMTSQVTPKYLSTFPVTTDQLVTIATDPELGL